MDRLEADPQFRRWRDNVRATLIPLLDDSNVCLSIVPTGEPDIKFAVELGLMIMMDKPILTVITPGAVCPPKLALVSDMIVECDIRTPEGRDQLERALQTFADRANDPGV